MDALIEIHDLPIDHIEPNPQNPNQMDDQTLDALRDDISRRGFIQPILVRAIEPSSANPKIRYRLVDGEHRWRVMGELGAETIPCVITEEDEADADVRMLTMNRLRGQMVPVRLAHLLADLSERVDPEELTKRLAMDATELKDLLDLAGAEEPAAPELPEEKPDEEPEEEPEVTVTVVATAEQARTIRNLLPEDDKEHSIVIATGAELIAYNSSDETQSPS